MDVRRVDRPLESAFQFRKCLAVLAHHQQDLTFRLADGRLIGREFHGGLCELQGPRQVSSRSLSQRPRQIVETHRTVGLQALCGFEVQAGRLVVVHRQCPPAENRMHHRRCVSLGEHVLHQPADARVVRILPGRQLGQSQQRPLMTGSRPECPLQQIEPRSQTLYARGGIGQ